MKTKAAKPAVKRCPICMSDRIGLWLGGYTGAMYHCPECNYIGPVVIEQDDQADSAAESG